MDGTLIGTRDYCGMRLSYRLSGQPGAYGLSVSLGDEAAVTPAFAADRETALRRGEALLRGTVPPCAVLEVLDEMV